MAAIFPNRSEAGSRLAQRLQAYAGRDQVLVLALPRGGVPVGYEVARALGVELDVLIVRKLGVPHQPELAMGAIASGGARYLNQEVLQLARVSDAELQPVLAAETRELERRERVYRGDRPPSAIAGRTVILVDDGMATGASMRAAVLALRSKSPTRIVVAVPVAPEDASERLAGAADE
ncbi:MAG: phosphoribosyltransferase, partial [Gammaproteobacteria bacterium]|nr:phosphoribosyltransferase [Gammaproteobacteria bacterium]